MFIVFEGLDGSGSTTQAKLLADHLREKSVPVLHTSEPTDNIVGGLIRGALTHEWETSPEGLQLLFAADRAHHLKFQIEPALREGKIVICDRYNWSTVAYGSLKCDPDWLVELGKNFRKPDVTILLRVPPKRCMERIAWRGGKEELFEKEEILKKVWKMYEKLADTDGNTLILSGEDPRAIVHEKVVEHLRKKFPDPFLSRA